MWKHFTVHRECHCFREPGWDLVVTEASPWQLALQVLPPGGWPSISSPLNRSVLGPIEILVAVP